MANLVKYDGDSEMLVNSLVTLDCTMDSLVTQKKETLGYMLEMSA